MDGIDAGSVALTCLFLPGNAIKNNSIQQGSDRPDSQGEAAELIYDAESRAGVTHCLYCTFAELCSLKGEL